MSDRRCKQPDHCLNPAWCKTSSRCMRDSEPEIIRPTTTLPDRLRQHAELHAELSDDEQQQWMRELLEAADEIERLRARVRVLECALRFYANPGDYKAPFTGGMGALYFDCGSIARAALEQKP